MSQILLSEIKINQIWIKACDVSFLTFSTLCKFILDEHVMHTYWSTLNRFYFDFCNWLIVAHVSTTPGTNHNDPLKKLSLANWGDIDTKRIITNQQHNWERENDKKTTPCLVWKDA